MTASPDSLQQRYEAIERVYSERHWDEVASLSEALLLEVPDDASDPLRQRLQLLLGHTHLYGFRDAATASGFYSRVQAVSGEAVLRDIADQGLQQCANQLAAAQRETEPAPEREPEARTAEPSTTDAGTPETPAPETTAASAAAPAEASPSSAGTILGQAFPFTAEPVQGSIGVSTASPAMPWLEQLVGVDPAAQAAAAAAAAGPLGAAPEPERAPAKAEMTASPAVSPSAAVSAITVAETAAPSEASNAIEEPGSTEAVLAVEVIDEPELIDVAQADPSRAEELDLAITTGRGTESGTENSADLNVPAASAARAALASSFSPEEMAELSKGLLRVVLR